MAFLGLPLAPNALTHAAAGALMLALAAALLRLNFGRRLHRAFALFLVLRAVLNLTSWLGQSSEPAIAALGARTIPYFHLAVPFAAFYFAWVFHGEARGQKPGPRGLPWLFLAAAVVLELAYAGDHSLWGSSASPGALLPLIHLKSVSYAVVALLAALDWQRAREAPRRQAALLVAVGFALGAAYALPRAAFLAASALALGTAPAWFRAAELGLAVLGLAPLALLAAMLARGAGRDPAARRSLRLLALPAGSFVAAAALLALDPADGRLLDNTFDGVWTMALPLLVTYALVRHQLFGIELKVKWTIKQSTVAAAFLFLFFVVSEAAQQVFSESIGPFLGIVAAGALVFAMAPLQRAAERVANAAMPDAKPYGQLPRGERFDIYREQVRVAWQDGVLTKKDRRILDVAREELGLTHEEAARLEREASG